jgi:photosystem II stability/assembly factor-like uncharacterized protein
MWECARGVNVSTDGGQTWQATDGNCGKDGVLSFVDADTGWAGTESEFNATTDGGATWETLTLPEGVLEVAAISLRTSEDGYLLETNGVLHTTQDGGTTWSSIGTLAREDGSEITDVPTGQAPVRFLDADHGMVVLDLGKDGMTVLRTKDGGQTWKEESLGVDWSTPYLSPDGMYVTLVTVLDPEIIVLRYQGE